MNDEDKIDEEIEKLVDELIKNLEIIIEED